MVKLATGDEAVGRMLTEIVNAHPKYVFYRIEDGLIQEMGIADTDDEARSGLREMKTRPGKIELQSRGEVC